MKKLKLFLSLCMMCLCIAVLCMGILAINSITYNITGTMTYNMIDGIALVNTRVYKVAGTESSLSTVCSTLSTKTFEAIEQTSGYILSQKLDTKATLSDSATQTEVSSGSISIDFGATDSSVYYYTYYIVVNITNLSDTGTLSTTLTDKTSYASGVTKSYVSSQTSIAKSETKNIVIGLTIPSTTTAEINTSMSYSLGISFAKYQCTLDGTTIYFTKDMTWAGYVATLSDSSDFDISGTYLKYNSKNVQLNSSDVTTTSKISNGATYVTVEAQTYSFTVVASAGGSETFEFNEGENWNDWIEDSRSLGSWGTLSFDDKWVCVIDSSGKSWHLCTDQITREFVNKNDSFIAGNVYLLYNSSGTPE